MRALRAILTLGMLFGAALGIGTGCAGNSEGLAGDTPALPEGPLDPLSEAAEGGPAWEGTSPEFCAGVASLSADSTLGLDQLIDKYQQLLPLAPAEISAEIEALLAYLTAGAPPEFAEMPLDVTAPPTSVLPGSDPADDQAGAEADEWRDDVVYGTEDAEQVAVMLAAFLEFRCRGTAVNPLPAARGLESQSDS